MKPVILATMLAFSSAGAATPPAPSGRVDQIGTPQPIGMDQVVTRTGNPASTATRAHQSLSPQVSEKIERAAPARQLTAERGAGPGARQLTTTGRTAQPSQPLSRPSDGRTSAVERVVGNDRCDPARRDSATNARCAKVIETRAAEFTRRDPTPLSPEQRIIMEQQQRERAGSVGGAARRLAANGDDVRSIEA